MNYAIVLNGLARNLSQQIDNVANFAFNFIDKTLTGDVIAFYASESQKNHLLKNPVGDQLNLIKVQNYNPEIFLEILKDHCQKRYDFLLFPGGAIGEELSVRLSCRLGGSALVSVDKVSVGSNKIICCKQVYSGYMAAEFILKKKPFCLSIFRAVIDSPPLKPKLYRKITEILEDKRSLPDYILDYHLEEKVKTFSLDQAKFIVVGGNGLGSQAKVIELQRMAETIKAGFGVSKPVVMSAFTPMNRLIGVSGALTQPELCIAVCVSGAPAFFTGIENSQFIVSINIDKHAPIIKKSDVSIIDNYKPVITELVRLIQNKNGE